MTATTVKGFCKRLETSLPRFCEKHLKIITMEDFFTMSIFINDIERIDNILSKYVDEKEVENDRV